jgi:hypothetical protein
VSDTYTKLFRSITASTIVSEPLATRWLWVTLLSQADGEGCVWAAVPGLARLANIDLADCERALECFLSPDPYSRTQENEGRRIEAIDGGWRLLNHAKYDALRSAAERAEYKRQWDRNNRPSGQKRAKQSDSPTGSPTTSDTSPTKPDSPTASLTSHSSVKNPHTPADAGAVRQGKKGLTFRAFVRECHESGQKPIPPGDSIFKFTATTGIPTEFLELCWREFSRQYRDTAKVQKDWRSHFRNAVRRNWYRLWWFPSEGQCDLTTAGVQLRRERESERAEQHEDAA